MLVEISISNYRSIGDKQTLSLTPAPKQKEYPNNIITEGAFDALNAIAIYGSNASGKSNLLRSISVMNEMVHISSRTSSTTKLPFDPFVLKEGYVDKPTEFEIVFVKDEKRYRYGFSYMQSSIIQEWLYRKNVGREVPLFLREGDVIDVRSGFQGSKKLIDTAIEATRDNALFLSQCDSLNVEEAVSIMAWFDTLYVINGLYTEIHEVSTVELWQQMSYREKINQYISTIAMDIHGIDISLKQVNENDLPSNFPARLKERITKYNVQSFHQTYAKDSQPMKDFLSWDFDKHESEGSKKALQLSGPVLKVLMNGEILVIDELEAKLHPIITLNIIDMFLDPNCNPKHAQLIFATHDTNLLSYSKLRRDQIYFTEKNKWESTELFSLSDFVYFNEKNGEIVEEKERKDTDKEKRYLEGRYGAIPLLGDFKNKINKMLWQSEEN